MNMNLTSYEGSDYILICQKGSCYMSLGKFLGRQGGVGILKWTIHHAVFLKYFSKATESISHKVTWIYLLQERCDMLYGLGQVCVKTRGEREFWSELSILQYFTNKDNFIPPKCVTWIFLLQERCDMFYVEVVVVYCLRLWVHGLHIDT